MNHATLFCSPVISSFVALNLHDSQTAPARLELYCLTPAAAPRNATFHFLSCFPSDFVVWRRQTEMVCMCVDVTEALTFSIIGAKSPNETLRICSELSLVAFSFFFNPPATLWLTFHGSNPLNLQHNGCHCTIALALFHTEQPQSGETPCVQWVLAGLLARWERRRLSHTCGFSFFLILFILITFYEHTVHIFVICCEQRWQCFFWHSTMKWVFNQLN